jgi:hypothetical protein
MQLQIRILRAQSADLFTVRADAYSVPAGYRRAYLGADLPAPPWDVPPSRVPRIGDGGLAHGTGKPSRPTGLWFLGQNEGIGGELRFPGYEVGRIDVCVYIF